MEIDDECDPGCSLEREQKKTMDASTALEIYLARQTNSATTTSTSPSLVFIPASRPKRRRHTENSLESISTRKYPAKTLLYFVRISEECAERVDFKEKRNFFAKLFPDGWGKFFLHVSDAEEAPSPPGLNKKVLEFRLLRTLHVAICPPQNEREEGQSHRVNQRIASEAGVEGWSVPRLEASIWLNEPVDTVQLIDDDKKKGFSQAFLTDMFTKMTL